MKNIATTFSILTIIVGGRIFPQAIVVSGIEVPIMTVLLLLSIGLLGFTLISRKSA